MSEAENLETVRRYLLRLSEGADAEELASFLAPDVVQEEFPNRLLPQGATRDLHAVKEARARGRKLLHAERFELLNAVASGQHVALEVHWTGIVREPAGPFTAGQTLSARFAVHGAARRPDRSAAQLRLLRSLVIARSVDSDPYLQTAMIDLYNADTEQFLGTIGDSDLQALIDTLEEESTDDRDYYINETTIELLTGRATDQLIDLLRDALGSDEGLEIRWQRRT